MVSPCRTRTRFCSPSFALTGVPSGISPISSGGPLGAGRAPGVTVDHVAEREHDVPADERPGRQDEEGDDRQADRHAAVGRGSRANGERDDVDEERDDHQRAVDGRPRPRLPVGHRVVGEADDGGGEHRQDPEDQRDIGGSRLSEHVEHDHQEQGTDRRIGEDRVERVAEPGPVEQAADRDHPSEHGVGRPDGPSRRTAEPISSERRSVDPGDVRSPQPLPLARWVCLMLRSRPSQDVVPRASPSPSFATACRV